MGSPLGPAIDAGAELVLSAGDCGEAALVERCRTDRGAFAAVYRAHYAVIVRYLFRRTGDRHAAEDLAAETFMAALTAIGRYRIGKSPLRSWLYRIATNEANRWANARRRALKRSARLAGETPRSVIDVAGAAGDSEQLQRARQALLKLKTGEQSVLALHYFEGLSVAQIATALGWREGTVKSSLSRGRESLRKELEKGEGGT